MINDQTALIKQALSDVFDRVLDLYDGINIPEHKNELLCFVGIDSYILSEPVSDGTGSVYRSAEVKYLIKLLGRKNMSAAELAGIFDKNAADALFAGGMNIVELKRNSASYSKEQGCHTLTAQLTVSSTAAVQGTPESVSFSVGGRGFLCMTSYEIKNAVKTADTPTIGNGIRTRTVGKKPVVITIKGAVPSGGASAVYSSLSTYLSGAKQSVSVDGMTFASMVMTGLDLIGSTDGVSKLTVEFTEVNED